MLHLHLSSPGGVELLPALREPKSDFRCRGLLSPWRSNACKSSIYSRDALKVYTYITYNAAFYTVIIYLPLLL